jgi:hypothetical protein
MDDYLCGYDGALETNKELDTLGESFLSPDDTVRLQLVGFKDILSILSSTQQAASSEQRAASTTIT